MISMIAVTFSVSKFQPFSDPFSWYFATVTVIQISVALTYTLVLRLAHIL